MSTHTWPFSGVDVARTSGVIHGVGPPQALTYTEGHGKYE